MGFLVFYFLFSWAVVYKAFEPQSDDFADKFANVVMSMLWGWMVFPLLLGIFLRDRNQD